MSIPKSVTVSRNYQPSTEAMSHAMELLLSNAVPFDSQASRGGSRDLTNNSTQRAVKHGPRTKEQEKT
jgi:hypothetical protein